MRPLFIDCSPRKGGNSDSIVAHISRDHDVDVIYLRDYDYAFCNGCDACSSIGKCVHDDDASRLYEDIVTRDTIVLVAPVYFYNFDGHTKGFIDRAQYRWSVPKSENRSRSIYLIAVGGQDMDDNFVPMERTVTCLAYTLGARYRGGLFFGGVDQKGDIEREDYMTRIDEWVHNLLD